jgi:hypothetical protein
MTDKAGLKWCPGRESNPHVPLRTRDFKSRASANFATRAGALHRHSIARTFAGSPRDKFVVLLRSTSPVSGLRRRGT